MRPSAALESNRVAIRRLVEAHRALNSRVFGPVLRGDDAEGSDLALLIEPTSETSLVDVAAIQVELQRLLGAAVDVLTPRALPNKFRDMALAEAVPV